jgi:hypothetical protein
MKMKWAKLLMLNDDEKMEDRLFQILTYFEKTWTEKRCVLNDIDATGNIGTPHLLGNGGGAFFIGTTLAR